MFIQRIEYEQNCSFGNVNNNSSSVDFSLFEATKNNLLVKDQFDIQNCDEKDMSIDPKCIDA